MKRLGLAPVVASLLVLEAGLLLSPISAGGSALASAAAIGNCGDPATLIHDIQGSGLTSPLNGTADAVDVEIGDWVRVQGDVNEYYDLTELNNVSTDVVVCGSTAGVTAATLTLPFASDTHLERYEGMQVLLPQSLSVTENHNLGRYGEVIVSSGGA